MVLSCLVQKLLLCLLLLVLLLMVMMVVMVVLVVVLLLPLVHGLVNIAEAKKPQVNTALLFRALVSAATDRRPDLAVHAGRARVSVRETGNFLRVW